MRKLYSKRFLIVLSLILVFLSICVNLPITAFADNSQKVYLGGMTAGFSIDMKGAHIIGISDVLTDSGFTSPSKDSGIEVGDVILSIDGQVVNNSNDVGKAISDGKRKTMVIQRGNSKEIKDILPSKDISGQYKLGIFIKDKVNGIGTITYFTDNYFASLGHPVVGDSGEIIEVTGGQVFQSSIKGIIKGRRGVAGELKGVFLPNSSYGDITKNQINGLYGKIEKNILPKKEIFTGEPKVGKAKVRCSVDHDQIKEYDIQIIKTEKNDDKNLVVKIVDRELVALTGGIVQGMSGSPIIQDGKLVGAVTHVFLNDPLRGYGLSIDKMLNI